MPTTKIMYKDTLLGYLKPILLLLVVGAAIYFFLLRRPTRTIVIDSPGVGSSPPGSTTNQETLEMVTLLPKDAIPSIDFPEFYPVPEADLEYDPKEFVIGVIIDEQARAYSTALLDNHEIVNDTVGGRKIAVTW